MDAYEWKKLSLSILSQMLNAIVHIKCHKIAHRDIKMDNWMINKEGELVLIDFGFCLDGEYEGIADLKLPYNTSHVSKGGRVSYLPPEIIKTTHSKTSILNYEKSDEYGVGIILNEIFEGKDYTGHIKDTKYLCKQKFSKIVFGLLEGDPKRRLSAKDALEMLNNLKD